MKLGRIFRPPISHLINILGWGTQARTRRAENMGLATPGLLILLPGQAIGGRAVQMDRSGVIDRQGARAD